MKVITDYIQQKITANEAEIRFRSEQVANAPKLVEALQKEIDKLQTENAELNRSLHLLKNDNVTITLCM